MHKSIILTAGTLAVASLAYSGIAWHTGNTIEQGNTAYLQELEKEYGFVKVEGHSFKNKVFSSDETALIAFPVCPQASIGSTPTPLCELAKNPVYLKVATHYSHGPIPGFNRLGFVSYQTSVGLDQKNDPELLRTLSGLPKLSVHGLVDLKGGMTGQITIPAIQLNIEDKANPENTLKVMTQEITGQIQSSQGLATLSGNLSIPLLSFSDTAANNRVEISGINIRESRNRLSKYLFAGTDDFTVEKIILDIETPANGTSPANKTQMNLDKLKSHYEIIESTGLMDFNNEITGESLLIGGQQFGPFAMDSYFRHVKTSAMEHYFETMQGIGSPFNSTQSPDPQQLDAIKTALLELTQSDPTLGIDKLEFKLPGGDASFNLKLSLHSLTPDNLDKPNELLGKVELQSAFSATESAIAELMAGFAKTPQEAKQTQQTFPAMVKGLIEQGYVRREGNRLAANASFTDLKLTVNGKLITLPDYIRLKSH